MKNNNVAYRQVGDYNIPNLVLSPEESNITLGKWGIMHKDYLLKNNKELFVTLLVEGKLWQYLANTDARHNRCLIHLLNKLKKQKV